jgi:N-acetyl-gamma-glutamylphosphate reductase
VRDAEIVANPGCYPTVTLLALLPLLARGLWRSRPESKWLLAL